MELNLRIGLTTAAILVILLIASTIRKQQLNIKYSIVWMLWALFSLLLAIFPEIFFWFSHLLGIEMPSNAVFLIMIGLLYALVFYVYIMISKHNEEIIELTYEVSKLKKDLEDFKKDER